MIHRLFVGHINVHKNNFTMTKIAWKLTSTVTYSICISFMIKNNIQMNNYNMHYNILWLFFKFLDKHICYQCLICLHFYYQCMVYTTKIIPLYGRQTHMATNIKAMSLNLPTFSKCSIIVEQNSLPLRSKIEMTVGQLATSASRRLKSTDPCCPIGYNLLDTEGSDQVVNNGGNTQHRSSQLSWTKLQSAGHGTYYCSLA